MRKIIVLGGGESVEREVSLRSSREVVNALQQNGFSVDFIDPKYSKKYLQAGAGSMVFPILHGEFGEDGTVQKELEEHGVPYLGSDSHSSRICFDKWLTREALVKNGISVAKGELVDENTYTRSELSKVPHVLKAVNGGSSIGTAIVRNPVEPDIDAASEVFSIGQKAVIEELITGIEITVPILDDTALPVIEIIPPPEEEFDYENKYNGKTQEICPAVNIPDSTQTEAKKIAYGVHKALHCRHLSRVDIIVRPDGSMVVLEINTMPGLTAQSLYPKAASVVGLDFPGLASKFVNLVERDYGLSS